MKKSLGYVFLLWSLVTAADQIPQEFAKIPIVPDTVTTMYEQKAVVYDSYSTANVQAEIVGARLIADTGISKGHANSIVVTSEDIQKISATTVPDILQQYAGITKYSNATGTPAEWNLAMRGFSGDKDFVVVVDGIRVNEIDDNVVYWPLIPVDSIEKIEIQPGAQSAIYGSGAFAGAVYITTKKAVENKIELATGSFGYGHQKATMGVARGDFKYRLSYDHQAATGYRSKSDYDLSSIIGVFSWTMPQDELTLLIHSNASDLRYPGQLTETEMNADRKQTINPGSRYLQAVMPQLSYKHAFTDDIEVLFTAAQRDRKNKFYSQWRSGGDMFSHMDEIGGNYVFQTNLFNRLTAGYEYRLGNIESTTAYGPDYHTQADHVRATKGEYAPFVQVYSDFGPMYLRYGVREDKIDYVYNDVLNQVYDNSFSFSHRSHSAEIGVKPLESMTLYCQYGEAFRAPNYSQLFGYGGNKDLTPELAKTTEIGVKNTFANMQLDGAVFSTIVDDEIMWEAFNAWDGINTNMGKTSRTGYTLHSRYAYSEALRFEGTYTYTKARFLDGSYATLAGKNVDLAGYGLPLTPQDVYSLSAHYQQSRYAVALYCTVVGAQIADSDYENEQSLLAGYSYLDLMTKYFFTDSLTGYLGINNLLNNIYSTKKLYSSSYKEDFYTPADLRSMTIGGEYKF